jgi:hypothetical protein
MKVDPMTMSYMKHMAEVNSKPLPNLELTTPKPVDAHPKAVDPVQEPKKPEPPPPDHVRGNRLNIMV